MTRRAVSGAFLASLTRDEGAAWGPAKSYGPARHEVIGGRNWAIASHRRPSASPSLKKSRPFGRVSTIAIEPPLPLWFRLYIAVAFVASVFLVVTM